MASYRCDSCKHDDVDYDCSNCGMIIGGKEIDLYEPKTNADRIRAMSDEELVVLLMCPAEYDLSFNKKCECGGEMSRNCVRCTRNWLRSESEG